MAVATEEIKKKRGKRRNFAAEREKVVGFCRVSIAVIDSLVAGLADSEKRQFAGKREAYQDVLRLMGEHEEAS